MAKSKSSRRWLDRDFGDEYVKKAQREGYRSRAAFKLLELQEQDRILRPGMLVVDLGAAPGGWSQVARDIAGAGRVVALDMLRMEPIAGVEFIQGDFREDGPLEQLRSVLGGEPVDLVLSDMAPNLSGMKAVDQPRAMYLSELALGLALDILKPGGSLVVKMFHGEGFDEYLRKLRVSFAKVAMRKPLASRNRSREVYSVATGLKV